MEAKRTLTRALVQAAIDGEPEAVDALLAYYAAEMDAVCARTSRKRDGTIVTHIDEDMRNQIKHMFLSDLPNKTAEELLPQSGIKRGV